MPNMSKIGFNFLVERALRVVPANLLQRLFEDRVTDHSTIYHERGVLGHSLAVVTAYRALLKAVGITDGCVALAVLHDYGKLKQFVQACKATDEHGHPGDAYYGHEKASAAYARALDMSHADQMVIGFHWAAYRFSYGIDKLVGILNNPNMVREWLLLCAADAVGRGWTEAAREQRPLIAERFREVASLSRISEHDPVLLASRAAVEQWEIPTADLTRFIPMRNGRPIWEEALLPAIPKLAVTTVAAAEESQPS